MTTPIERAADALAFVRVGPHLTLDSARTAFKSIDRSGLINTLEDADDDEGPIQYDVLADAILKWLLS